jgi:hypothetical protein
MAKSARIDVIGDHPVLRFAARELARYLSRATGWRISSAGRADQPALFRLGVCSDLGIQPPRKLSIDDDWICIRPAEGGGYLLSGSNPRGVLFAVYRYLRECGFRWLRPGQRGEIIPSLASPIVPGLRVTEAASYRYRTICIEGAVKERHVRDLVDWQAKHGMNGYFIQFHWGSEFFNRWWKHECNPFRKPEPMSQRQMETSVQCILADIPKRGMRLERMGHGWTCAALGLPGEGWDQSSNAVVSPDKVDWLAQIDGKKELFKGVALNTNLNYGNPAARSAVVDALVSYAKANPQVQLLHLWLADDANNHDERPESQAARPSDFYVDMLNELDEKLSAADVSTRIVFLIYVDLLWPPIRSRIKKPDRFVLMFGVARPGIRGAV